MASVQYLIEEAFVLKKVIFQKKSSIHELLRINAVAAIKIQRNWRGYAARKKIKGWNAAATVIQKTYRGWIIRWNSPQLWDELIRRRNEIMFNRMATRIQAVWRGYWTRKNLPDDLNMVKRAQMKKDLANANAAMTALMADLINQLKNGPKTAEQIAREEEQCKQWVMYILFKCHHLLRTKHMKGIYSLHEAKYSEYSFVEEMLKALPMRDYMENLRNTYYEMKKNEDTTPNFVYEDEAVRKLEAVYKLKDISRDVKELDGLERDCIIQDKPFDLIRRKPEKPYERQIIYDGQYTGKQVSLDRTYDPTTRIGDNDFTLTKKMIKREPTLPPYYIDAWKAKKCNLHYPTNLLGD